MRELETRIGRALIGGDILDGARITVDLKEGKLAVCHENPGSEQPGVDTELVDA